LDLAGHEARAYDELSRFERLQVKVADLQATGQSTGVKKTVFTLVPPPRKAELSFRDDGMLEVRGTYGAGDRDVRTVLIDPTRGTVPDGAPIRVTPEVISKPP